MQPTPKHWGSLLALGLIWGGTFMVMALALRGYGPFTVATARVVLGAVSLLGLMIAMRRPMPPKGAWPWLIVIGLLNTALPFFLLSWGLTHVPSAFAGISMAALPLLVLPLAHWFSDERMTRRGVMGVTLGFAGALVLIGPGVMQLGAGMEGWGQLACLAATVSYAISSILTRRAPNMDSITMAAMTLAVGAALMLPLMLIAEGVPGWVGIGPGLAILFLGFVPTALAALIRVYLIRSVGSVFMTLVNYQVPLWSVVFGWAVLGEDLPWRFFAALGLILAGLVIGQWATLKRMFQ
jgi:drug/metabolite transporter (DMT)-like permease